ncbi:MAG TPA: IPExxxVDY family protein [Bacteroidia bacterium]|nr:IPExxxVDY family protein [Bacteroidia bacterium]
MAKHILKTDTKAAYDFMLFGIICQSRDYKLCFEINRAMNLSLERGEDFEVPLNKGKDKIKTVRFEYNDGLGNEYYVMANKTSTGLLIPEHKSIDYFLMVRESTPHHDKVQTEKQLRSIPIILGAYYLEPEKLKTGERFIF